MMMIGDKDPVLKLEDLLEQVSGTDTTVIRFSEGHMSHIENKEEILEGIGEFLKKN
jgi:pimeloyl-ACP methyl ester carboxylesterase